MIIQEKIRLREVLYRHQNQLGKFLSDPERDEYDLHYTIAGLLRVLLCDGEVPILLYYAKEHNIELKVWGSYPARHTFNPNKTAYTIDALIASYTLEEDAYEMNIEEYLDTEIGAVPKIDKQTNLAKGTIGYTPKQLIKWICNKDGVAHLELKPMASLESIKSAITVFGTAEGFGKTDAFHLRLAIIQIGEWTLSAIKDILAQTQ
ncbi:hypothetical protein [Dyadobacter sediminis]|uniref:Uncharacterized protein n=1 Tax=Dyadobacter sediminis TaxID=1493691 RepID=A0A5R9KJL0_9BACT|nr:hypothetical protein [Dyadobacter sediminis]TLU96382.1 hypothetical protein FEM55_04395 [Dyadobacter sediminis]GGB81762.1 hypothetical protein GCM10011325_06570 [Dyadobacter sediminis]